MCPDFCRLRKYLRRPLLACTLSKSSSLRCQAARMASPPGVVIVRARRGNVGRAAAAAGVGVLLVALVALVYVGTDSHGSLAQTAKSEGSKAAPKAVKAVPKALTGSERRHARSEIKALRKEIQGEQVFVEPIYTPIAGTMLCSAESNQTELLTCAGWRDRPRLRSSTTRWQMRRSPSRRLCSKPRKWRKKPSRPTLMPRPRSSRCLHEPLVSICAMRCGHCRVAV